ncbi:hypothetical protein PAAG_12365 [Paracoccidioides lutzii Pb01]|uniref:Uncharacterized protein n=1 Tax=Paracoccidioides lutzii (strain ATCC MYA-826 / Pb01) TaxID=502779 RepID=A0A0A2V095_PARBA|nr:hypothetical protein PAAG_12365 [Paracoccidioides lutzii Pb01]KGQ00938.1 hypothetical protein PAAG_12365 [Paracoccidioides lutzii Pb01]
MSSIRHAAPSTPGLNWRRRNVSSSKPSAARQSFHWRLVGRMTWVRDRSLAAWLARSVFLAARTSGSHYARDSPAVSGMLTPPSAQPSYPGRTWSNQYLVFTALLKPTES